MPLLDKIAAAKNRVQDRFAPKKENWTPPAAAGPPGTSSSPKPSSPDARSAPPGDGEKSMARKAFDAGGKALWAGGRAVKTVGGKVAERVHQSRHTRSSSQPEHLHVSDYYAETRAPSPSSPKHGGARGVMGRVGGAVASGAGKARAMMTHGGATASDDLSPRSPLASQGPALVEIRNRSNSTVTVVMDAGGQSERLTIHGDGRGEFHLKPGTPAVFEVRDILGSVLATGRLDSVHATAAFEITEYFDFRRIY